MEEERDQILQVDTTSAGWQDCEVVIQAISSWRVVGEVNIPPKWLQVKIKGKKGKVSTKWLSPLQAQYRLKLSSGDLNVRRDAARTESAWDGCGTRPGTWVWRIEDLKVKKWPEAQYGEFHVGDSYIVLHAHKQSEESERLLYKIHFWIGKESTTDEMGTAAYKTVELDSYFNEEASQHREVQDGESDEFRSYFDEIKYLPGGVPTGFRMVARNLRGNILTQVWKDPKGVFRFTEVPVTCESLNHRDAFVLTTSDYVYIWHGEKCTPMLKSKAMEEANRIKEKRNVKMADDAFWPVLGGKGGITSAAEMVEDKQVEFGEGKLFELQICDTSNKVVWTNRKEYGDLHRSDLATDGVNVVDTRTEIFVWVGKGANAAERKNAWYFAGQYLKDNNKDINTVAITLLKEGSAEEKANTRWIEMFPFDS